MCFYSLLHILFLFKSCFSLLALDQHLAEANVLREAFDQAQEVLAKQSTLVASLRASFYAAMGRVRAAGRDPAVVLTHLSSVAEGSLNLSVDDFAFLATSFNWDSPLRMPKSYTVEQQELLQASNTPEDAMDQSADPPAAAVQALGAEESDGVTKLLAPPLSALPSVALPSHDAPQPSTSIEVDPREGAEVPEGTGDASSEGPVA